MPASRWFVAALLACVVAALAFPWLLRGRAPEAPPARVVIEADPPPAAAQLEAERPAAGRERAPGVAFPRAVEERVLLRVPGFVRLARSGLGLEGARLWVESETRTASAYTKRDGSFVLSFTDPSWHEGLECAAWIDLGTSEDPAFEGRLRLESGMVAEVVLERSWHGRVRFDPRRPEGELRLAARLPDEEGNFDVDWGERTRLGERGAFELASPRSVDPAEVELLVSQDNWPLARVRVRAAELASDAGAELVLALCDVEVLVADEAGNRLPGAFASFTTADGRARPLRSCDEAGSLRFLVAPGELVVRAEHERCAPARTALAVADGERSRQVELRLHRLDAADEIRGRVLDTEGVPRERVRVTATPLDRDWGGEPFASASVVTGADGVFRLGADGRRAWRVRAEVRESHVADELVWRRGAPALELVLRGGGTLSVAWAGSASESEEERPLLVLLAGARGEPARAVVCYGLPVELDDVPEGDWDVLLCSAARQLCGQTRVRVAAGESHAVECAPGPAQVVRGRVRRAGSAVAAARVVRVDPAWPGDVLESWAATTDAAGRFELCAAADERIRVRVLVEGREAAACEVRAGVENEVELP